MGEWGGYRQPAKPAAVSGPGKMSARTDGKPGQGVKVAAGGGYGDRQAMESLQSAAPMSASADTGAPADYAPYQGAMPTPFGAPSERPDEPVTAGAPVGPGPGPEALGADDATARSEAFTILKREFLPRLAAIANRPSTTDAVRALYRYVRDG